MAVIGFSSPNSTTVSADAGSSQIYIIPDAGSINRDEATYFLSADAAVSGIFGSFYAGAFWPHHHLGWDGNDYIAKEASFIASEFPCMISKSIHNNQGQPAIKVDKQTAGNVTIVAESGT